MGFGGSWIYDLRVGSVRSAVRTTLGRSSILRAVREVASAPYQRITVGLAHVEQRLAQLEKEVHRDTQSVLELYVPTAPSPQNAVDIFAGEWASRFPDFLGVTSGWSPLFESEMVTWGVELLGGVTGQRLLELGPLEGAHTYILDRMGASEIVAVEANNRAFLKCLVTKELLDMTSAKFVCGDAIRYLERAIAHDEANFDLCLASGILYHLIDPVAALDLITRASDRLLLWTMYFDEEKIAPHPELVAKFVKTVPSIYKGFAHTLHHQEYKQALDFRGFCGGSAPSSAWMTRADILGALEHFGFEVEGISFEGETSNGPCFAVAARRRL